MRAEIQMPDSDSDSDADEMLQYKVILLGDGTVGKTSIAMRFTNDTFGQIYKQVLGSQCCPAAGRRMPARAAKLSADALSPAPPPPAPAISRARRDPGAVRRECAPLCLCTRA